MRRRIMWISFFALCVSISSRAEDGAANTSGTAGGGQNPGRRSGLASTIQVFDDRVFDSIGVVPREADTRQGASGKVRYLAPEADYNYGQRQRWLDKCAPLRNLDRRSYQDCFQKEREGDRQALDRTLAEVEAGQGGGNPYYPYPERQQYRFDDPAPQLDIEQEYYD